MKYILAILLFASTALAGSLPILKYRALDNSGDAISGAKLNFYEAGTTTRTATYSDEALTSANANPVVADSAGYFGEIYMQTDQSYKVVLTDASDVTIWTVDNINAGQLVSDAFQTRLTQAATNPLDQGAIGDGAADESTEVQAAIDAATGVVDLLGKTYRCDSALVIDTGQNGVVIKNGTLNFSNSSDNYYIFITGTAGSPILLTGNASVGDTALSVASLSGVSADDWFLLQSTGDWASGIALGELIQVDSAAALTVNVKDPIESGYTTATAALISEMTPASRIRFENVRIIGSTSASGTGDMVYVINSHDISFSGCTFENFKRYAIAIEKTAGVKIEGCSFEEGAASAAALYTTGAVRNVDFTNNTIRRVPIGIYAGITGNYQTRWLNIVGNKIKGATQGVVIGLSNQYSNISGNDIIGDASGGSGTGDGIYVLSPDFRIENNNIREAGGNGILVDTDGVTYASGKDLSGIITGNRIWEPDNAGIDVEDSSSPALTHVEISGNHIYSAGAKGIVCDHEDALIQNNTLRDYTNTGIEIGARDNILVQGNRLYNIPNAGVGIDITATASTIMVTNNMLYGAAVGTGIRADNIDELMIVGNYIRGASATNGIDVDDSDNPFITNNFVEGFDYGITIEVSGGGTSGGTISSNVIFNTSATAGIYIVGNVDDLAITGNSIAAADCILTAASASLNLSTISGNRLFSPGGNNIELVDGNHVAITGNIMSMGGDASPNINLNGDGVGEVSYILISGNVVKDGTYSIGEATDANNTNIVAGFNLFDSFATAPAQGTVATITVGASAANTICNATCAASNYTCLAGFDSGTSVLTGCSDATSDTCLCQ